MTMAAAPFTNSVLANLVIPAHTRQIPPAVQYVSAVVGTQGLPDSDCVRLEGAVEEACSNVIKHAFAAGEEGTIRIEVERQPGAVSVRIHDQGLPADLSELAQGRGLGFGSRLMHAFADEVRFHNLGQQGKCIELLKRLPYDSLDKLLAGEPGPAAVERALLPAVQLRFMRSDESIKLARCIYFAYGYSYGSDYVYYPQKTREMIESGLLASCIAVTPDDDIVGHCAIVFEKVDDLTAESAVAAVLPSYRGQSLFERMKTFLMNAARDGVPTPGRPPRKLYGLFSEAATIHPFTQMVNHRVGCTETGLLLAYAPSSMQFKAIEGGVRSTRQSGMMMHVRTNPEPHRVVYAPARHRAVLEKIYGALALDREFGTGEAGADASEVESRARPEWGQGYIGIHACGPDLVAHVKQQLHSLCLQKVECVLLDLPLSDPGTPAACEALEALGFFFGGVLVEKQPDGDVLRMQYLNNVQPDLDAMHVVTDFGKDVRDYVVSCLADTDPLSPHKG